MGDWSSVLPFVNDQRKLVLLVEDDAQDLELISAHLLIALVKPVPVTTLGAAIEEVSKRPFSLVLLDLVLPDSPWAQTVASIRRFHQHKVPLVVIVTGMALVEPFRRRVIASGAADIIGKDDPNFSKRLADYCRATTGQSGGQPIPAVR